jgi:hypothetical protein
LVVPEFLHQFERSGLSTWLRESPSVFGFYFVLVFHTIGLAMLVGPNTVIDLRLLGVGPDIPLAPLKRWFPIMWVGLGINVTSGIFLVIAYPIKAFTNPDFYIKLTFVGLALWILQRMKTRIFANSSLSEAVTAGNAKMLAVWSLVFWFGAISAARLLAYTCTYLVYGVPCE